jgi:hypothetical protein
MVTATAPRRLTIPTRRHVSRERLLMVTPWFLRAAGEQPAAAPPALLTFTQDDFIDRFFAGIERAGDAYDPAAAVAPFERLIAFRDYAEPPVPMLDATGAPRYPASIARRPTPGQEFERDPTDPTRRIEPPDDDPAWLRKLYPGLHRHFHIVTTELVCARRDFPRVGKDRIVDAGFIVRRLVRDPDPAGGTPRWEDWLPSPVEGGIWLEVAGHDMSFSAPGHAGGAASQPVDPRALSPPLFDDFAAVRARLGIPDGEEADLALAVEPLSLVPATVGRGGEHTALFGYLPLPIGELQRPPATPDAVAAARTALAARARRHLETQLLGATSPGAAAATAFVDAWADNLHRPLARLFETVTSIALPTTAAQEDQLAADAQDARDQFNDFSDPDPQGVGGPPNNADAQVRSLLRRLLVDALQDRPDAAAAWWDDILTDAVAWWDDILTAATDDARITAVAGGTTWASEAIRSAPANALTTALTGEARRIARRLVPPPSDSAPAPQASLAHARALAAALLRRVRRLRIELVRAYYELAYPPFPLDQQPANRLDPPTVPMGPEHELIEISVGTLSAELDAWIAADIDADGNDARKDRPQPWPRLLSPTAPEMAAVAAHRACAELEQVLADLDSRGAGAGRAYFDELDERMRAVADNVFESVGGTPSGAADEEGQREDLADLESKFGLDLVAQPERGLFVHPTFAPTRAGIEDLIDDVAQHFAAAGDLDDDAVRREAEALEQAPLPRYDPDHLYGIWSWARVRGRTPCEQDAVLWSNPSEVFTVAEPADILGMRPVPMRLPDLPKLVRDLARIPKAKAVPVSAVGIPPDSDVNTGALPIFTSRKFGAAFLCTYGIPVFTICAWVLFTIVYNILKNIPGFTWMQFMKTCIGMPSGE